MIKEIISDGHDVVVSKMVDNLTEEQSIKIEAELIAAFGTEATGGTTNAVIPSNPKLERKRSTVRHPEKQVLG